MSMLEMDVVQKHLEKLSCTLNPLPASLMLRA